MSTTIQIQDSTKEALFREKNRLEGEVGRTLTYDDVITHLLEKKGIGKPNVNKKEFFGMMDEKAREIYSDLRKEYRENDF